MWQHPYPDRSAPAQAPAAKPGPPPPQMRREASDGRRYESKGAMIPHPPPPPHHAPPRLEATTEMNMYRGLPSYHHSRAPLPPPHHHAHHHHSQGPHPPHQHRVSGPYGHSEHGPPPPPHHNGYYHHSAHHGHPPPPRHAPPRMYYDAPQENRTPTPPDADTEQYRLGGPAAVGGRCTCKKSQCLKLYCQCFSSSTTCGPKCKCQNCHNTKAHGSDIEEARRIILERNPSAFDDKFGGRGSSSRPTWPGWEDQQQGHAPPPPPYAYPPAPEAAHRAPPPPPHRWSYAAAAIPEQPPPPMVTHKSGCRCRRSFCLKKYCECYTRGAPCGNNCRCTNCRNQPDAHGDNPPGSSSPMKGGPMPHKQVLKAAKAESPTTAKKEEGKPSDRMAIMAALAMTELGNKSDESANSSARASPTVEEREERPARKRTVSEESSREPVKKRKAPSPTSEDDEVRAVVSASSMSPIQSRNASPVITYNSYNNHKASPYGFAFPRKPLEETARCSGLPKALSFRKICSKCGKTRSEHGELGFGNKCVYQDCGRCGAGVQMHEKVNTPMGILCTLTVEEGATPGAAESYEKKIRDLAVRAEIQRGLQQQQQQREAASNKV